MRSVLSTTLSALLVFGLTPVAAKAAPVAAPLGVVVIAEQAKVADSDAVKGSSVFEGDRMATGETGQLQVRFGATQTRLFPGSLAVVSQTSGGGLNADLLSGTVSMSSAAGQEFSLTSNQAMVRPASGQTVIAQVTRVSPRELLLSSRKGALEVTFDGEVTTIAEGSTYRMVVDPAEPEGPQGTGAQPAGTVHHSRKRAAFILLGAAAAITGAAILSSQGSSVVSPSTP
jgi:hypothetical protein